MTSRDPNVRDEREPVGEEEEEGGLDLEQVKERLGFALRGPRRHPKLAAAVFVIVASLGVTVAITMPRTYSAQVRLLAQRNFVVPALTNPNRVVPRDADNPTRNVADMIMRRENLSALCKELSLVDRFYAHRSAALRLKDAVLGGSGTEADKEYAVVGTLEKKLTVQADENSVTIAVDWTDPQLAFDIVSRVQQNFLEARYDNEVAMIGDAITVLQDHAKSEMDHLNQALDEYQKLLAEEGPRTAAPRGPDGVVRRPVAMGGGGPAPRPSAAVAAAPDPELTAALEDKRRQIRAMEDDRQRELSGLRQQLSQAQLTLTPQHPTVIALQQQIDARSQPMPELIQLKNEERQLTAQLAPPAAVPGPARGGGATTTYVPTGGGDPVPLPSIPPLPEAWQADGRAQLARSKLDAAIKSYQDVAGRIDTANIELEIARTAFKYRYTVVTPPEVPKKPKKPLAPLVGVGSIVAAVLLSILFAAGRDAMQGRILEPWQVRRKLKLDVLGELEP
jgi:uncharacterized protein involved in exopolysaccharide biosynthesis